MTKKEFLFKWLTDDMDDDAAMAEDLDAVVGAMELQISERDRIITDLRMDVSAKIGELEESNRQIESLKNEVSFLNKYRDESVPLRAEIQQHVGWLKEALEQRDSANRLLGEAVKAMQQVVWYDNHRGPGLCTCDKCTAVRNFLTTYFAERPVQSCQIEVNSQGGVCMKDLPCPTHDEPKPLKRCDCLHNGRIVDGVCQECGLAEKRKDACDKDCSNCKEQSGGAHGCSCHEKTRVCICAHKFETTPSGRCFGCGDPKNT